MQVQDLRSARRHTSPAWPSRVLSSKHPSGDVNRMMREDLEREFETFALSLTGQAEQAAERILGYPDGAVAAVNTALDQARKNWRRLRDDPSREALVIKDAVDVALAMQDRQRRRSGRRRPVASNQGSTAGLMAWLRRLPNEQREALILTHVAQLPETTVAAAMGLSLPGLAQILRRALDAMACQLDSDQLPAPRRSA